ncbi:alpha/beta hydrolase [Croceitalea sp. MTPC9]|uniref:Alpha/beta fold hydrolase n=1 Tax=Croceitalea marina TaxID=1775166 RepID=A0ABW5N3S4_9FLAO|nr:alpha/beta hydrolase [Croceitalea sp. MTPC5]GMN11392.1 alpha/beta hydrolase [Croceitalea sp. MTPC6]GMN16065.1 alpha/beta hydrolase [Croceitalea sp. MTPC9]
MKKIGKTILAVLVLIVVILFVYTKIDKSPSEDTISKELRNWKSNSEVFQFQQFNISYFDTKDASKEVIVLLHGYPTSSFDWSLLWEDLKKNYRLIALDMLGFGLSDKPSDIQYSISLQADIQEAILKNLQIKRFHILAHDYGDNVAQEMIARFMESGSKYPFQIRSATLLNGGLFPETHKPTRVQSLLASPLGSLISPLVNQSLFENSFKKVFGAQFLPSKQDLIDQWYLICQQGGNRINHKLVHASNDRIVNQERWRNTLVQDRIPILFINGLQDPVTGKETVDRYRKIVPNPNLITLDSIGHFPQLEAPKLVQKNLVRFINNPEMIFEEPKVLINVVTTNL